MILSESFKNVITCRLVDKWVLTGHLCRFGPSSSATPTPTRTPPETADLQPYLPAVNSTQSPSHHICYSAWLAGWSRCACLHSGGSSARTCGSTPRSPHTSETARGRSSTAGGTGEYAEMRDPCRRTPFRTQCRWFCRCLLFLGRNPRTLSSQGTSLRFTSALYS
jgi:hypothetical protein